MTIDGDFTNSGFSIRTAYYLAKACAAAYLDDIADAVVELGMAGRAGAFVFGEFNGFVADLDGAIVVAFRGTASIENWLTDGRVVQIEDEAYPGKVHRGFAGALQVIWPGLLERLPPVGTRPVW